MNDMERYTMIIFFAISPSPSVKPVGYLKKMEVLFNIKYVNRKCQKKTVLVRPFHEVNNSTKLKVSRDKRILKA